MQHKLRAALFAALLGVVGCERAPTWTPLAGGASPVGYGPERWPFDEDERGVLARDVVTADTSAVLADLFGFLSYGAMFSCAAFWVWWHRRRSLIEQASDPRAPLRDGAAMVVGTVEAPPGWAGPVVRIDIHQTGTEWQHKGAWNHAWREHTREINVRPFIVVRDDGVRVQVEPDARVAVHDRHDDITRKSHNLRIRVCDIQPGERVHVFGELVGATGAQAQAGAYRQGMGTPVIRPPAVGRMVISAEPPGATSLERMRFHRNWAIAFVLAFAFVVGVVMPEYVLLATTGQTEWVTPDATDYWRTWHKPKNSPGYYVYHHAIRGSFVRDGRRVTVSDETGDGPSGCVERGDCARVPFVVSTLDPSWHQFGRDPHLTNGRVAILVILLLIFGITYPATAVTSRPWYLRKKVNDGGSGPLSTSLP